MKKEKDVIWGKWNQFLRSKFKLPGKIFLYTFTVIVIVLAMYIFSTQWDKNIYEFLGWENPNSNWFRFFIFCVVLLLGTLLTLVFVKRITLNLTRLTRAAQQIGKGNLTGSGIDVRERKFPDETDDLSDSINQMLNDLRELVSLLKETSGKIYESSDFLMNSVDNLNNYGSELNVSMTEILNGAKRQKDMVVRALDNVKNMAGIISQATESAGVASRSMKNANKTAVTGEQLATEAIDRMQTIFDQVEATGKAVSSFVQKFKEINKMVDFITSIAQKTNLLALNASIEAARAGESGKGFAIVAEEIRKLADSTSKSTGQISDLVNTFEKESVDLIASIQDSVRGIAESRSDVGIIINSLDNIVKNVVDVSSKVGAIAEFSEKQTMLIENVVDSAESVGEIAEKNTQQIIQMSVVFSKEMGAIDKMGSSAKNMNELSTKLQGIVQEFKTEDKR